MWGTQSQPSNKQQKQEKGGLAASFRPENLIPGIVIGFIFGLLLDLSNPSRKYSKKKNLLARNPQKQGSVSNNGDQELKMVLVVRQDLKMGAGKIASQCAHAATGMYADIMQSYPSLLRQWEQNGQPKVVVTCKNQQEMNKLKEAAESIGLPTFVVADAGRTQVLAGSKTVLAIGPGMLFFLPSDILEEEILLFTVDLKNATADVKQRSHPSLIWTKSAPAWTKCSSRWHRRSLKSVPVGGTVGH